MAGEKVNLFGHWASPFALRVHWALKLKGLEYDYQEEDLPNKSPLLLQYNPVHKKIPVLVHNGKPIAESLVILEYIEETWKHNPLLPEDPYERAKARFWVKFVDDKCVPGIFGTFSKVGEEQQKIAKEARENLKILQGELGKKRVFGDTKIGFIDVASAWIICWAQIVEEIVDIKLIDAVEMPSLVSWFQNVLEAVPILLAQLLIFTRDGPICWQNGGSSIQRPLLICPFGVKNSRCRMQPQEITSTVLFIF